MQPKNLQIFISKTNELITEIDEISNTLSENLKALQLRKNEFRDKCLQFLKFSFDDNEYYQKFNELVYEVSQNDIYLNLPKPTKNLIRNELDQLDQAKNLLNSFVNNCKFIDTVINEFPSGVNEQGLYFKGQYYDAIFKLSGIIKSSKSEIKVVDNYINEDLINFLQKDNQVEIKIITSSNQTKEVKQLKLILSGINAQSQYQRLEIKESNNFHDRFIIVDSSQAYHFGASLKQLGDKGFMFSKIQQNELLTALINGFNYEWSIAKQIFPNSP